ncbi:MAG TPA: DUF488 family protein [Planctomycetota bacterium]
MVLRIVRLGSPRAPDEGLRLGTVRRPPRGVPKAKFVSGNWYDLWFPTLAPSVPTMKLGLAAATAAERARFFRRFRAEMQQPAAAHAIALLAVLSHRTNLAVGCYCEHEANCHRSALRELLLKAGAKLG